MLREVRAVRYVSPLREGGSLPGVVEGDDLGLYALKFRGAGQGPKVLVAEVVVGELARRLGLPVPELAVLELDPVIGRGESDDQVQALIQGSGGANLGCVLLPGAVEFSPLAFAVDPGLAARVLWLDALTCNVDRSWRNPNLLVWRGGLWLIDHGAALWFHHAWSGVRSVVARAYDASDHVLAPVGLPGLVQADAELAPLVDEALLRDVVGLVPEEWLVPGEGEVRAGLDSPGAVRDAYVGALLERVAAPRAWLPVPQGPHEGVGR